MRRSIEYNWRNLILIIELACFNCWRTTLKKDGGDYILAKQARKMNISTLNAFCNRLRENIRSSLLFDHFLFFLSFWLDERNRLVNWHFFSHKMFTLSAKHACSQYHAQSLKGTRQKNVPFSPWASSS